jgi:hypothetical protein
MSARSAAFQKLAGDYDAHLKARGQALNPVEPVKPVEPAQSSDDQEQQEQVSMDILKRLAGKYNPKTDETNVRRAPWKRPSFDPLRDAEGKTGLQRTLEQGEDQAAQLRGKNMPSSKSLSKADKMQDVAKVVAKYAPALLPLILAGAGGAFAGRVYEEDAKPNENADAKRKRARNRMLMGGGVGALMSAPLVLKSIKRIKKST